MYVLILMVFTATNVAIEKIEGYDQAACYEAAEQFEVGASPSIADHRERLARRCVGRIAFCVKGPELN